MTGLFLWMAAAYLLGSVPVAYLAGRLGAGIDLREHGSKNAGATNVQRVMGWKFSIPVGVLDIAKGVVATSVLGTRAGSAPWMQIAIGSAAVFGHVFPVFLGFRGGKGVATAAGVVLVLAPGALGISALIWLATVALTGYVSLASILAAGAFPVATWITLPKNYYTIGMGVVLATFILLTHRVNLQRLRAGTENRFRGLRRGPR